jgi:hypothetical protein
MALSKNAQRTMWQARKAGAGAEETLAACLAAKASGMEMEDEATLWAHIQTMRPYQERGPYTAKARKDDPAKVREAILDAEAKGQLTADQAEALLADIQAKEDAAAEKAKAAIFGNLLTRVQAL